MPLKIFPSAKTKIARVVIKTPDVKGQLYSRLKLKIWPHPQFPYVLVVDAHGSRCYLALFLF